jgi:hypothetical protein
MRRVQTSAWHDISRLNNPHHNLERAIQWPFVAAGCVLPVSKNPGYEAPADFGAILLVAGEILSKKLFFVRQSPNKAKNGENRWDETPIGAKCESHCHKE